MKRGIQLGEAARGYRYQDLVVAYFLARSLLVDDMRVAVNVQAHADDAFDDLGAEDSGGRMQFQVKSGAPGRQLRETDFTAPGSRMRIDKLVRARAGYRPANRIEPKLLATWLPPDADSALAGYLRVVDRPRTFADGRRSTFQLDHDAIWPTGSMPRWRPLRSVTRRAFVAFSKAFLVELAAPGASLSLESMGDLEERLRNLLQQRVGVGVFPNERLAPLDAANRLVGLARTAREESRELDRDDVMSALQLRADHGRVSQAFPLDAAVLDRRTAPIRALASSVREGSNCLVVGPPGSGKSWLLTLLADRLRADGYLVARHYCYLEPGDPDYRSRIQTAVMYGDLIGELIDAAPGLRDAPTRRLAAGRRELEEILIEAAKGGARVALIIDGLDHIARAGAQAVDVPTASTTIVEELSELSLPAGVALLAGSQPGDHLQPLLKSKLAMATHDVPTWNAHAIARLALRLAAFQQLPPSARKLRRELLEAVVGKAAGNPLCATLICRDLEKRLEDVGTPDLESWIATLPDMSGGIDSYYTYLMTSLQSDGRQIGYLLSVLGFSVTRDELAEMLPRHLSSLVQPALQHLRPVLVDVQQQGGVRLFHESFQRHLLRDAEQHGVRTADLLEPIIDWLRSRRHFDDARSFRFLPELLYRAGRKAEVLQLVDRDYLVRSVAGGQPRTPVQRNLHVAVEAAAHEVDWASIVRLVELNRAAYTCFEEKLADPSFYWEAFADVHGAQVLVDRLLFDAQVTLPIPVGLRLCALADDAGVVPPWAAYLSGVGTSKAWRWFTEDAEHGADSMLACTQGWLRTSPEAAVVRIADALADTGQRLHGSLVRAVGRLVFEHGGKGPLRSLRKAIKARENVGRHVGWALELASCEASGRDQRQKRALRRLARDAESSWEAASCALLGAGSSQAWWRERLVIGSLEEDVLAKYAEPHIVDEWLWTVRGSASSRGPSVVASELERLAGVGWYRCWLRYCVHLAVAEALPPGQRRERRLLRAFAALAEDTRPFAGEPRACDLHKLKRIIPASITRGLSMLQTGRAWSFVADQLADVGRKTGASFQRGSWGPLDPETLLEVLLPLASRRGPRRQLLALARGQLKELEAFGTFYEAHARGQLLLARIEARAGENEKAEQLWAAAAPNLMSYGWRKDVSIYDLIESAPHLRQSGEEAALQALASLQPLTEAILIHTDGKATNRMPLSWFRVLLECAPRRGLQLLAESAGSRSELGWYLPEAIALAAQALRGTLSPGVLASMWSLVPIDETDGRELAKNLRERGRAAGDAGDLRRLEAQVWVESRAGQEDITRAVASLRGGGHHDADDFKEETAGYASSPRPAWRSEDPCFPVGDTMLRIRLAIEEYARPRPDAPDPDAMVNALGFRLLELSNSGRALDAEDLIVLFASKLSGYRGAPVELIALGLGLERFGQVRLAATALTLAFATAAGNGGYHALGDDDAAEWFSRALLLDGEAAWSVLAQDVARKVRLRDFTLGVSGALVARLADAGKVEAASRCWWTAFDILAMRLRATRPYPCFGVLEKSVDRGWSETEEAAALIMVHADEDRLETKHQALLGLHRILEVHPGSAHRPLAWALSRDRPVTSSLLLLQALRDSGSSVTVDEPLEEILGGYAAGPVWGCARLATQILERAGRVAPRRAVAARSVRVPRSDAPAFEPYDRRLDLVDPVWPGFTQRVMRRLRARQLADPHFKDRAIARYRARRGEDGESWPPVPTLLWEAEVLEACLHEELVGLHGRLWELGHPVADTESRLLDLMLPRTDLHVAMVASSVPRPPYEQDWMRAVKAEPLRFELDIADGRERWVRIGAVERQWMRREHGRRPYACRLAHCGLVILRLGSTASPEHVPASPGSIDDLFAPDDSGATLRFGPLVRLAGHRDWLGREWLLVPAPELLAVLRLTATHGTTGLAWSDGHGRPGMLLRRWEKRNAEEWRVCTPERQGVDLILRGDLFTQIEARAPGRIVEVVHVDDKDVPASRDAGGDEDG